MTLEDQCVNLSLSKRLKELGVKQDSIFDWVWGFDANKDKDEFFLWLMSPYNRNNSKWKEQYSAFTVAELGELLPVNINDHYFTSHRCARNGWWAMYTTGQIEHNKYEYWAKSEAEVRAKMLVCLIEQGIIKL